MSDAPRTDALIAEMDRKVTIWVALARTQEFARELERELDEMTSAHRNLMLKLAKAEAQRRLNAPQETDIKEGRPGVGLAASPVELDAQRYAMLFRNTWHEGEGIAVFIYTNDGHKRLGIAEANARLDAVIERLDGMNKCSN